MLPKSRQIESPIKPTARCTTAEYQQIFKTFDDSAVTIYSEKAFTVRIWIAMSVPRNQP